MSRREMLGCKPSKTGRLPLCVRCVKIMVGLPRSAALKIVVAVKVRMAIRLPVALTLNMTREDG